MELVFFKAYFVQAAFYSLQVSDENEFAVHVHHKRCVNTFCWWDIRVLWDHLALRENEVAAFTQGLAFTLVSHLALLRVYCLQNIIIHILSERERQDGGGGLSCSAVAVC